MRKEQKEKKKMSRAGLVLTVGLIIIAIPCLIFGWILLSAALETGKPIVGDRFEGDLNPAIEKADTSDLVASIKALEEVEDCTIELTTAQYRVNVDVADSLEKDGYEDLINRIYELVNAKLPVNTYFTMHDNMKMYDLSIGLYNHIGGEDMIYVILTKNSTMDVPSIQTVSQALDEDLAQKLRGETEDNSDGGDDKAS